ncbi:MAG: hypothetical protein HZA50_17255 [Planctomycetes bacterium]|nr:hypothetical protein [Planctomycetota bacterium]
MKPREVVKRAVEFNKPDRLAVNGYGEISDTVWINGAQIKPPQAQNDPTLDQWMCRWAKTDTPNMGQIKGHPLEDFSAMKDYPWPDGNDGRRYTDVDKGLREIDADPAQKDKYRITSIFMLLWERMEALHGLENCMVDMMENTPQINELADRITEYDIAYIRNMKRIAGGRIDAFNASEDWGTELDLMVSPELFRGFFLPRYKRIFKAAHECNMHVWIHSCGKVNKAMSMFIEAGIDVINLQQPLTNGIDELGKKFAGKIVFESLCDIQKTLPKGDRDEIKAQARQLMRTWGTPKGGFVLGDYGDAAAIGADPAVKQFMLDRFRTLDPWKSGW